MNTFIIIISVAIIAVIIMYASFKNAEEIKEEEPKFQPRKVTYIPKKDVINSVDKPKKKYYKKRNKKKKPAVAQNETTEKRPVGRPRKTTE
jgi:FtsZ-interacting cell division protein ZipA